MNDKRYFEKDFKKLILDYKLLGPFEEVVLRTNLYNHTTDFHDGFILFWSERDLVIVGKRRSIFSDEYLPLSIKLLSIIQLNQLT